MRRPARLAGSMARGTPGSIAAKASATSATLRARTPGVSKVWLNGTMPSVDQRPAVTLRPTVPVALAGIRTEPAVSVPSAISAEPSSNATPAPLDEPPGERSCATSQGLRGQPQCALTPVPPKANSTMWVLPTKTPAWRRNAAITGPSCSQRAGKRRGLPAKVGMPATAKRSLGAIGMPCSGPRRRPPASALSARWAIARAKSGVHSE